ncbi:MAG: signal recognition particle protein [Desulfobacterales bacterium]
MFEQLSEKLESVFKKLRGHGRLTEANIEEGLREVRLALLEADVHYRVVKQFIDQVRARALGQEVMASLTPGQQVVKIVHETLCELMGSQSAALRLSGAPPACLMLVGLQGSGKTTTAAKLALRLRKEGRHPLLVPADVYRPAAIEQLQVLGDQLGIPVFPSRPEQDPVAICLEAKAQAFQRRADTLVLDTAGRLHIDEELMAELGRIREALRPGDILFVADAMTGQDAVNSARAFNERLDLTGVILTKMDGDARGGAALSIRAITGKPILFIGVGEKPTALEPFHPERIASSILGMGDVLGFIEKAREAVDQKKALELQKKLRKNEFTLEDFRDQLRQVRRMGSLADLLKMIPGMGKIKHLKDLEVDDREFVRIEAIINSMTPEERRNHRIINGSRRRRIAAGSGTRVQDVNGLLKNYDQMLKMLKKFQSGGLRRGAPPF